MGNPTPGPDYAAEAYKACLYGRADAQQQRSVASALIVANADRGRLLAALEEFSREYDGFQDGNGDPCPTLARARAAIATVRGQ